ncbi:MAG: hypothetical protein ACREM2_05640, partial [Vulcanimicrobiaceae bacterium]
LRLLAVDDVGWALRARACDGRLPLEPGLAWLEGRLATTPAGTKNWVLIHIPPGIDAFSTAHLTADLVPVPFLRPAVQKALVGWLAAPRDDVALVLAAHTHKFSFRLVPGGPGGVGIPVLLAPSVSPIFDNAPSFLVLGVTANGSIASTTDYSFDGGRWQRIGSLAELGMKAVDAAGIRAALATLDRTRTARHLYARLYEGGAPSEFSPSTWPVYRCAFERLGIDGFERCLIARRPRFFDATLAAVLAALIAFVVALVLGLRALARRRRAAS